MPGERRRWHPAFLVSDVDGQEWLGKCRGWVVPETLESKDDVIARCVRPAAPCRSALNTNFVPIIKSCCSGRICRLAQHRHAQAYIVARPIPILISSFCSLHGFISHTWIVFGVPPPRSPWPARPRHSSRTSSASRPQRKHGPSTNDASCPPSAAQAHSFPSSQGAFTTETPEKVGGL
jgi:hypothetical protein